MQITISTREQDNRSIVEVSGEVDVHEAPTLDAELSGLIEAGNVNVIVDFTNVEFLDSTGLGVLVKGLKRAREHDGSLTVVATADRIVKVFRITGLDSVIGVHATVSDALAG
ncbi:MAG: STAS domain-containing protein [Candidatus Nanopelagicales bacterium]|nr:STAS domain-containing protein [Candidatus Nanopelagicales bacterium]